MFVKLSIALVALALTNLAEGTPTCAQITSMSTIIKKTLTGTTTTGNLASKALRLGFHDCVGGCNGCINFNNGDNAGLADVVSELTSAYNTNGYSSICSLADFFALATTVSISNAVQQSNIQRSGAATSGPCPNPAFTLKWGRTTATDCSTDASVFPSPTMTGDAMFTYYADNFGFSKEQTVALMGAHSFGGAKSTNSGYNGKWTGSQNNGLSEVFFTNMLSSAITWKNTNVATSTAPKWQFNGKLSDGTGAGFMLNTDFALYYNLTLDSNAQVTCSLSPTCGLSNSCTNSCAMATTFNQAHTYSQNCTAFMTDFVSVIQAMLINGYSSSALTSTTC